MARGDRGSRGVTCRECGCLNFNSEHEVCDRCHPKALTFYPTAHRLGGSTNGYVLNTSNSRSCETRVHSLSKKRRHHKSKNTSNKKFRQNNILANKEPDVIDLISDEDDDDELDIKKMVHTQDKRQGQEKDNCGQLIEENEEKETKSLFQSRVFPNVIFVANHFPSVNAVAIMRRQAAKEKNAGTGVIGETIIANVTATSDQVEASEPTLSVLDLAQEKAAESVLSEIVESDVVETVLTTMPEKVAEDKNADGEMTHDAIELDAAAGAEMEEKEAEEDELELEELLFRSRVFDSIEFRASDFVTAFDGLAVARRSHTPISKTITSTGASLTSVGGIVAAKSDDDDENDVAKLVTETTVTISTSASAPPSTVTITTSVAKPTVSLPSESASLTVSASTYAEVIPATSSTTPAPAPTSTTPAPATTTTTPAITTPATSSTVPAITTLATSSTTPAITTPAKILPAAPSASVPHLPPKAAVTSAALPPAPAKLPPTAVLASAKVPAVPPTKVPTLPSQASSLNVQSIASATSSPPTPAAVKLNPAASAHSAIKATPATALTAKTPVLATITPQSTTDANSAVTKTSCAPAAHSDSAHVLMPKKKHSEEVRRSGELERCQKPSPLGANLSFDADGILFVKVNPAPREIAPVVQPILGYCSPEFLEFMRECADDDGDEEGDPDEVSRSLLKLLDVVDLTNLSESEDSGVGSPSATSRVTGPKGEIPRHTLLTNEQAGTEGQSTVYTTANVVGKGTWYVPTLDSERKRTHAERIMCELCEEKVISSRLIRCPTCTKYYHKKCARENGDENICWNCELGSMIDDSELDEEHAKHNSEYLAYLKELRSSLEDGEVVEEEIVADNEDQEGDQAAAEEDIETASSTAEEDDSHSFSEESSAKGAGKRWKEFIGDATADIDASYVEVTKRIAEELRDDEKRRLYSRGFVSREEFEAQMTEVEEYYIKEEARLQQLEREKALEAKKVAEARKVQAEAEQTIIAEESAGNITIADSTAAMLKPVIPEGANAANGLTGQASPFTSTTAIGPAINALKNPATAPVAAPSAPIAAPPAAPLALIAAPTAAPTATLSTPHQLAERVAARTLHPAPSVPFSTLAAAFKATFDNTTAAGSPAPLRNTHDHRFD